MERITLRQFVDFLSTLPKEYMGLEIDCIDVASASSVDEIGVSIDRTGDPVKSRVLIMDG